MRVVDASASLEAVQASIRSLMDEFLGAS